MPHTPLVKGDPTKKVVQGGGLERIMRIISAISARVGAAAGDPRGLQYETQRKGEARQSLLDKQTAEHRAATLGLSQDRFGLERERFEHEKGLGRLPKPGRVFAGAKGGLWEQPYGGGKAGPLMREPLPEEVSGVAPGTLGPELPPEMRPTSVQMRQYEKPAKPTVGKI